MPERASKPRRSLHDSTVDISTMRVAMNNLEALRDELKGFEGTDEQLDPILDNLDTLEDMLKGAMKSRMTFSTVTSEDLKKSGIIRKRLNFEPAKMVELTSWLTTNAEAVIAELHSEIKKIYAHVNMDRKPGCRMIVNAILLALARLSSTNESGVAILPGMKIAQGDEVQISDAVSGYELWLRGDADYAIIKYDDVMSCKGSPDYHILSLYHLYGSLGRLFLVKFECESLERSLRSYILEAVGQAIALLKSTNLLEVRFCLSDGTTWIFFILKSENGILTYYESAPQRLSRDVVQYTDLPLREILQLLREWLSPMMEGLFTFQ